MDQIQNLFAPGNMRLWYKLFVGVYMALGYVYYASVLLKTPFSYRKTFLIFIAASLFGWVWNIVGSAAPDIYVPGFYVALVLMLIFVYQQVWRNAIFLALIHYFSFAFIPILMRWVYQTVGGRPIMEGNVAYWDGWWIHLMTAATMMLVLSFVRVQVRKIADYQLQNDEFLSVMIMLLPLAYISMSLAAFSVNNSLFPVGIIVVWSILSIGVMLNMVIGRKQQRELGELKVIEQRLQDQYQRHLAKVESSELIMQKCHDLQTHLRLFQETSNQRYLDVYQAELKATLDTFVSVYETGNATLDGILSEASRKCQTENITLICIADGKLVDFIEPIDICSIFGNILDNAIESARLLSDPEKKIIQLKILQEKYLLLIRVENYYEHEMNWQDGVLATHKEDKVNHGYGLKSIRYTAGKYHGNVRVTAEEGKFTLTILINR